MRQDFALYSGIFMVMALSNAIVPILPFYAEGTALQGAVYAAYFFGALITVLPAGIVSDRLGQRIFVQAGLLLTLSSGVLILLSTSPVGVLAARLLEGVGAGLFVPAAMSWVNSQPEHRRTSGAFMAALNLGLVVGLLGTGWTGTIAGMPEVTGGIWLFTILTSAPLVLSVVIRDVRITNRAQTMAGSEVARYLWLFVSVVVLLGATGLVSSLYPEYTGAPQSLLSVQIALMHLATVVTVYLSAGMRLQPVPAIRASALSMAVSVLACYFSPLGFVLVGAVAGIAINAQLAFLAETGAPQGAVMGVFNVSSYCGMSLIPFLGGVLVELSGRNFLAAFAATSLFCILVAGTIGRCSCRLPLEQQRPLR